MHINLLVRLVLVMAILQANAAATDPQKPTLNIAGSEAKTIKIQIDSANLDQQLRIDSMNPLEARSVEVILSPLVGTRQRWVQPQWRCWSTPEDQAKCDKGAPCTTVDVPGLKQSVCRITASFPEPDTYSGTLDLIYNQARDSFRFSVVRAGDDVLSIRGFDKEFGAESSTFTVTTGITSNSLRAVPGVRVQVHDLIGPDGRRVAPTVTIGGKPGADGTVDVPATGEAPLTITAELPQPGTFNGAVDLSYTSKRQSVPFTIKRADATVPLNIRPIETVRVDTGPSLFNSATLRVILQGTRSQPLSLELPAIVSLSRKQSDKIATKAEFSAISFRQIGPDEDLDSTHPLQLDGRTPRQISVKIAGLEPGEYTGTFSVGRKDLAPQEAAFTVYVRQAWWIAALLIALGVIASWWLRSWAVKSRPRLAAQRQLAQRSEDVEVLFAEVKDATQDEREVLLSFAKRLADRYKEWEQGTPTATAMLTDGLLKEIDAKIAAFRTWVNLRRRFDQIKNPILGLAGMRDRLSGFKPRFLKTAADDNLLKDVGQLSVDLSDALTKQLTARIDALHREVQDQKGTLFGKPYADTLDRDVIAKLDHAKAVAEDPARFAEAASLFENARLHYARILAAGLNLQLPAKTPDPLRIDQSDWDRVVAAVRDAAERARTAGDADGAVAAYEQAYSIYLNRLLLATAIRLKAAPEKIKASSLKDQDEQLKRIQQANTLADLCAALVANREFAKAAQTFDSLRNLVAEVADKLKKEGGQDMGLSVAAVQSEDARLVAGGTIVGSTVPTAPIEVIPERPARISTSVEAIDRRIRKNENIFAFVVGVISIVLGLKLLWLSSPTWGDGSDYVTALLWGLGLHQVAGAAMGQFSWGTMLEKWSGGASAQG